MVDKLVSTGLGLASTGLRLASTGLGLASTGLRGSTALGGSAGLLGSLFNGLITGTEKRVLGQ